MLCDICHKNIATVHLTEIVNEKIAEMHICQPCAKTKTDEIKEQLNISDFLGGLTGIGQTKEKQEEISLKCSSCGLTYGDFKKKGRFGCGQCYTSFKAVLLPLLKKIHGSTRHVGKTPLKRVIGKPAEKISDLKTRLARAIQMEEYEEAAQLRDEIKNFENKNSSQAH
ncbi:MAG: UvrB/UvrC motif-containing protein [Candidatus Omnitrophica bacterium]|nr:UvrB/UvrC motif-containing protein [Candidatus Omnitrophota bacterium]